MLKPQRMLFGSAVHTTWSVVSTKLLSCAVSSDLRDGGGSTELGRLIFTQAPTIYSETKTATVGLHVMAIYEQHHSYIILCLSSLITTLYS